MVRTMGPERAHFGGAGGLITVTQDGVNSYYWECMHCGWRVGGKNFQNNKARIHLSGDATLRNGLITQVCTKASKEVQQEFAKLERDKRLEKSIKVMSRKRAAELNLIKKYSSPAGKKRRRQSSIPFKKDRLCNDDVDNAWAHAFFGLDIAPNKINHVLFRESIAATMKAKAGSVFFCFCCVFYCAHKYFLLCSKIYYCVFM